MSRKKRWHKANGVSLCYGERDQSLSHSYKAPEGWRTPRPGGNFDAPNRALASWSAAVLCRFDRGAKPFIDGLCSVFWPKISETTNVVSCLEKIWQFGLLMCIE